MIPMYTLAFYNNPTAIIIIAVLVLVLFGGAKIPELMRGIGQGAREFKKGVNGEDDELVKSQEREKEARRRVDEEMRREDEIRREEEEARRKAR